MAEEVVVDGQAQAQEEGTVQEPQAQPQEVTAEEEGVVTLPSDVEEFTMPDKFEGKSAEEIAKSYMELEKFKGQAPEAGDEVPPQEAEVAPEGNKYMQEYYESGELSEDTYAELLEQGVSREDVDDRLEFESYKSKKAVDDLVSVIGGIEEFTAMDEWSKENMTPEALKEFGEEIRAASTFGKQAILKDVYSQYRVSIGEAEPTGDVVHTNEGQSVVTRGYSSQHELQADMADKRYGTDRSYTQEVEKKLSRSKPF